MRRIFNHKNPQDPDFIQSGPEYYKKGSFHNKLGMYLMWIFYGIITVQIVHLLTVLPWIFPALMGTGLALAGYVVLRVNWE